MSESTVGDSWAMAEDSRVEYFRKIQREVGAWSQKNFGDQLPHRPAMGLVEELNELQDGIDELDREKVKDAAGDVAIYMADYFYRRGWDLGEAWFKMHQPAYATINTMVSKLSQTLIHHHLKGEQNIRGGSEKHAIKMQEACSETLWFLVWACRFVGFDFVGVVMEVWETVSKRDWTKNPNNAHEVAVYKTPTPEQFAETMDSYARDIGAISPPHPIEVRDLQGIGGFTQPSPLTYEANDEESEF